jgi:hypothetical protein
LIPQIWSIYSCLTDLQTGIPKTIMMPPQPKNNRDLPGGRHGGDIKGIISNHHLEHITPLRR